jgi:hypothetical protein
MHYYDCPCDECRQANHTALYERLLHVIDRLEQELERPRIKEYDRALSWLAAVCGGPDAMLTLDTVPLRGQVILPDDERVTTVAALLRGVAGNHFDAETEVAFLRGLAKLWAIDPGLVQAPVSPSYVASGVAWVIGEANGCVGTDQRMTSSRLKHLLETPSGPAVYARPIRRALGGLWEWRVESTTWVSTLPALAMLGDPGLLTSRTRTQLVRVREHALAARAYDQEHAA